MNPGTSTFATSDPDTNRSIEEQLGRLEKGTSELLGAEGQRVEATRYALEEAPFPDGLRLDAGVAGQELAIPPGHRGGVSGEQLGVPFPN